MMSFSHNPYGFPAVVRSDAYSQPLPVPAAPQPQHFDSYAYHPQQQTSYQYVSEPSYYNQMQEEASLQYYEQQSSNGSFSQYSTPATPSSYMQSYGTEDYSDQVATLTAHQPYTNLPPAAACAGYNMQTAKHAVMAPSPIAIPAPRSRGLAPQVNVVPRVRRTTSIRSAGSNGTDEISSHSSEPGTGRTSPNPTQPEEEGPFHKPLLGRCEFIVPPPAPKFDGKNQPQYSVTPFSVFLGQVRLEIKPAALRTTIELLTGVRPSKIESRGTGCFLAYLHKKEDIAVVKALNRRVLFDKDGLWFARTEGEANALLTYVQEIVSKAPKGFRLPKDAMVVAEEKTASNSAKKL